VRLRNGPHGYGAVTKTLHWTTVFLLAAQFIVGYTMDDRGRGRGRGGDDAATSVVDSDRRDDEGTRQEDRRDEERDEGRDRERDRDRDDDDRPTLLPLHIALGLTILALALVRVAWRRSTPLPPWAPQLREGERRWLQASEKGLLTMLFAVPLTGLVLVLTDDDLLPLHVAAHVGFFVALAAHVGLVVRRRLLPRML
jgi:cytochrome b561